MGLGVPRPPHKPESKGLPQEMRVSEKDSGECCLPLFRFWKAKPETRFLGKMTSEDCSQVNILGQ